MNEPTPKQEGERVGSPSSPPHFSRGPSAPPRSTGGGAHALTPKSRMVCSTALRISSGLWSTRNAGVTFISLRSVGEDHTGVKTRFLCWLTPGVQQHGPTSLSSRPPREEGRMSGQLRQTQDRQPSSHAVVGTYFFFLRCFNLSSKIEMK